MFREEISKGRLYVSLSAILFGVIPMFTSISYSLGNNAFNMAVFSYCVIFPIHLFLVKKNRLSLKVTKRQFTDLVTVAVISLPTGLLLGTAYKYIGIASTTTIHFMYPVVTSFFCSIFFKEKLSARKIVTLFICTVGVLCFLDLKSVSNLTGVILAFLSSITFSTYMVWLDKKNLVVLGPSVVYVYINSVQVLILLAGNFFFRYLVIGLPPKAYIFMLINSIGAGLLAGILLQKGIRIIGASSAAIYSLFEPVFSIITGVLFLKEETTFIKACGCILILFSIAYTTIDLQKGNTGTKGLLKMKKYVIFDMDGVIIDSEYYYIKREVAFLKSNGIEVREEDLYNIVGATDEAYYIQVGGLLGVSKEEAKRRVNEYYSNETAADYGELLNADAKELLDELRAKNYRLGLATMGPKKTTQQKLDQCGLGDYFEVITTVEMVSNNKPDPEIYLKTAELLGARPEDCVVIEDSIRGVTAGCRAGMTVIGYIDKHIPNDISSADYKVDDLRKAAEIIEKL
ncbi:MAG: HAD-IA family hydrolase [Bacillota bacterium]|nr:HAD-IA family hydrolase [Bacillota bacterium]